MSANKYPGVCHACGKPVSSGAGHLERSGRGRYGKWLVWCGPCYNASDNFGPEDRECGNRAYEDRCAAVCGGEFYSGYGGGW